MTRLEMLRESVANFQRAIRKHGPVPGYVSSLTPLLGVLKLAEEGRVAERYM